jgi:hypothetical protein
VLGKRQAEIIEAQRLTKLLFTQLAQRDGSALPGVDGLPRIAISGAGRHMVAEWPRHGLLRAELLKLPMLSPEMCSPSGITTSTGLDMSVLSSRFYRPEILSLPLKETRMDEEAGMEEGFAD